MKRLLFLLALATPLLAAPYGCGAYGGGLYGNGTPCASPAPPANITRVGVQEVIVVKRVAPPLPSLIAGNLDDNWLGLGLSFVVLTGLIGVLFVNKQRREEKQT